MSRWLCCVMMVLGSGLFACAEVTTSQPASQIPIKLPNSDFETVGKTGEIPGWKVAYGHAQIVTDAKSGKHCLLAKDHTKIYSTRLIRLEPGYRYGISVWGKIHNLQFIKEGLYGVGYSLEELNADKQINGNWYGMYSYLKYAEGDIDWEPVWASWQMKETTVYLRPTLYIWAKPGSEAMFDDIRVWKEKLEDTKVQNRLNLMENHSFEVRYNMQKTAFGFNVLEGAAENVICVEDVHRGGIASMKISGPTIMGSNTGYLDTTSGEAEISVKTENVKGGNAVAKLAFFNKDHQPVGMQDVVSLTGTNDWKVFKTPVKNTDPSIRYVQWQIGMTSGESGTVWFDDLGVFVPSTLESFPRRAKNTARATVKVNCAERKGTFTSPLTAYDHHNSDRVYSPSIGTAGQFVDGPNHWYAQRPNLGFKYVRVHHIYQNNICEVGKGPDGKGKVSFGNARTNWPESDKGFGPIATFDAKGQLVTDFSAIKYMLDKSILVGGCKPIIGMEPVPPPMAHDWCSNNAPVDYKVWEELNYRFVKFLVDTYGKEEVRTWIFETGNEPGTEPEFHGIPGKRGDVINEFIKMQDYTVAGATRAFPEIFIAGPSGPPEGLMVPMLEHCAAGKNYATGKIGTKLDAISYHGYLGGHGGDISWRQAEQQILRYQGYIKRYEQLSGGKKLQLFNTEFTPIYFDGGRDPNNPTHEQNNHIQAIGTLHTGFFSHRLGVSLIAFFFQSPIYMGFAPEPEKYPEFQGIPTCITFHGIFNPVCRAYQMMSWLNGGTQVSAEASNEPIYSLATVEKDKIKVLCYNFDVKPDDTYTTAVNVTIDPAKIGNKFKVTRYELSKTKANSWYLAQKIKLTQADCIKNPSIVDQINRDSELKPESMGAVEAKNGKIDLKLNLSGYSAVLLVLEKEE